MKGILGGLGTPWHLSETRAPQFFIEPILEANKQKLLDFDNAAKARQERYSARGEAYRNKSHIHLINNSKPTVAIQRSLLSSAEDEAEQFRRRIVQASSQNPPQTPITGTSPTLGNFTSMSSPGGGWEISPTEEVVVVFPKTTNMHYLILRLILVAVAEEQWPWCTNLSWPPSQLINWTLS